MNARPSGVSGATRPATVAQPAGELFLDGAAGPLPPHPAYPGERGAPAAFDGGGDAMRHDCAPDFPGLAFWPKIGLVSRQAPVVGMIHTPTPLRRWQVSAIERPATTSPTARCRAGWTRVLPHPRPQLHPARISLPHRVRRRPPRSPSRGSARPRAGAGTGSPSPARASISRASGSARPASPPAPAPRSRSRAPARPLPAHHLRRRHPLRRRRRGRLPRPLQPQQRGERRARRHPARRPRPARGLLRRPRRARHPLLLPARLARRPARPRAPALTRRPRGRGSPRVAPLRPPGLRRRRGRLRPRRPALASRPPARHRRRRGPDGAVR